MKNFFFSSLRNSLLTLVLLAVLPALGVILYSSLDNRARAIRDAEGEALRVVQFLAREQQLITMRAEQLLFLLSQMPQVKALDGQATSAILRSMKRRSNVFANIVAADAQGNVFASALPLDQPMRLKRGRHFDEALGGGEFTVGDFDFGLPEGSSEPLIRFVYPFHGTGGQALGFLSTALRPDRYEHIFKVSSLPPGSVLSIADQDGTRIFRYPAAEGTSPHGQKLVVDLWNVLSGPSSLGTANVTFADGVKRLVAYTQLRLNPDLPPYLYISVGIPEQQALSRAIDTLHRDLLFLAGAALLAILVAWGVGGIVISRPVERLTGVARRLGGGDLDARSGAPEEFGELALLAKTLDDMAVALSEDISAREEAERELRKNEALLRMIMEALPVGVWMSDKKGRILYANEASRRIWGPAADGAQSLGQGFQAWRHDTGAALHPEEFVLARAIAGQHPPPAQALDVEGANGERKVVRCTAIPIHDEDGNLRAAIVVFEDITERTQREQARDSVEHILRHDLRSPLVGFASLPQLLLHHPNLTDEQRDWLKLLHASAGKMLRMLDAYLKLSCIERGSLALEPVMVDLVSLLHVVREDLVQLPQGKNKHVWVTMDDQPLPPDAKLAVPCEETLCASMLTNLVKNALEASPEGGIVTVDLQNLGETVRIVVRNKGEVPDSIRERFFEKFVTAGKAFGTGVGTYSAKRIAEFHGGSITLDCSVPGQTSVTVLLPRTQSAKAGQ
ncbi:MAG: ATP-binding protein [Humidesulfovibrio sp.]